MTYKINGKQYWKRNGVFCSWTEEEGRKVITEEEYLAATSQYPKKSKKKAEPKKDPKAKVEISYQEVSKAGNIVNKRKVVTYGNLDKVLSTMEAKDNFVKVLGTRDAE